MADEDKEKAEKVAAAKKRVRIVQDLNAPSVQVRRKLTRAIVRAIEKAESERK